MRKSIRRIVVIGAVVCLATVLLGRWVAYWQLLARRRTEAANVQAVEAALARRISTAPIAGPRCKLRDVLQHLADHCDVPVKIDRSETVQLLPLLATPIDMPDAECSVEELLGLITSRSTIGWHRVGWHRVGDSIVITSEDVVETQNDLITRVYPVPAGTVSGDSITDDAEDLANLISTTIEADSWDDVGGPGVVESAGGAIVVHHTHEIQQRIGSLIGRINALKDGPERAFSLDDWAAEESLVRRKLHRLDSVDFRDEPLDKALQTIGTRHQLEFLIDRNQVEEAGIALDTPITYAIEDSTIGTILSDLLQDISLTFEISGERIWVTTSGSCDWSCTWFYDVRDLLDQGPEFGSDELIDVITTNVEANSWDDVGGPGTLATLNGNWLVVSQSPDVQYEVQQLLARMRAILHPGSEVDRLWLSQADDVSLAVEEALDREVTLKYAEAPLCDVCDDLSRRLKIPVRLRRRALEEAAVTPEQPVSIALPPLPLRDALALLLEHFPLTFDNDRLAFDPRGEVLYVTTQDDADRNTLTRIIDVRHLISPGAGGMDEDTLIELVTTCVAPDSWDEVGGPGTTDIYRGLLVFSQTYDISRQVQNLIDAISEHCLPPTPYELADQPPGPRQPVWMGVGPQAETILAALQTRKTMHLEPPIEPSIRSLCDEHGIPCLFDPRWHAEARVDVPWPGYMLDIADQPLDAILDKLAESKNGGIAVSHGMLLVTDRESADSHLLLRLYPINGIEAYGKRLDSDEIADLLAARIDPDTWDERGGPGTFGEINEDWMLVVQTLPMHRRIEEALTKLRAGEALPQPPMLDP